GMLDQFMQMLVKDAPLELNFEVFRCELLAEGFLFTAPTRYHRVEPQPLVLPESPDAESVRAAVARVVRSPFARARVLNYVNEILAGRRAVPLGEFPLGSDE